MKEIWIVVLLLPIVSCLYNENAERDYNVADMNFTVCENPSRCISLYEEGNYGTKSSHDAVEGYLIHSSSLYGCKMFNFKVYRQPWIAFISRGECMFSEKINNAINHNASAVIIYNNKPTGSVTMIHENTGSVVAVSVSYAVGKEINSKLNNSSVFVKIAYDRHVSGRKFNTISVLFVSVSFIVLMVISLAWLVFYYVQRFRYLYARDKTEVRSSTARKVFLFLLFKSKLVYREVFRMLFNYASKLKCPLGCFYLATDFLYVSHTMTLKIRCLC